MCNSKTLACRRALARDLQTDPPVYILSNRIRFGRRKMNAEHALDGMRVDRRGAVALKIPVVPVWLRVPEDVALAWAPSCHLEGARSLGSPELAVGSRPPGALRTPKWSRA
jgi:hypothetical protein